MLFWIATYHFFSENGIKKWLSLGATILGIFVAIGFLGIVFTPADLYLGPHRMFNQISFLALTIVVALYAIAIYLNEDYPNRYCYINVFYIIIVAIYLIILFTGPSSTTAEGLRIQVTSQKILLFCGVLDIFIQAYGAWKLETS